MARTTTRRKGPARWAVMALTGLATVVFWAGVIGGPQPGQSNPSPTVAQAAPAPSRQPSQATRPRSSGSSAFQAPTFAPAPRFRTRAS